MFVPAPLSMGVSRMNLIKMICSSYKSKANVCTGSDAGLDLAGREAGGPGSERFG